MHSEIHLRRANWVEPDFPSHCVWQTWGHPMERAARKVILKEAGVRSWCFRSCDRTEVSQRQECWAGEGWEQAQNSSPLLPWKGHYSEYTPAPALPWFSKWQLQLLLFPKALESSLTPLLPSHPTFALSAYPISPVFKMQNISHHSSTPALVQATIIFHPNDRHSIPAHLLCLHFP